MLFLLPAFLGASPQYNLDGELINEIEAAPGTFDAGVRINTDGTVDERVSGAYSPIDSATDWIIPNAKAHSTHWVRFTENSYNEITGTGTRVGTMNTWLQLTTDREVYVQTTGAGAREVVWGVQVEIATDSGGSNIVASGTYNLSVQAV